MTETVSLDIDLTRFSAPYPLHQRDELSKQNDRVRGLWGRLRNDDVPGVILGDEVGKGKTYIALALAFLTLAAKKRARIVVLTHSRTMARIWANRWREEISQMIDPAWRDRFDGEWQPRIISEYEDFVAALDETATKSAIIFASYDTLKRFYSHVGRRRYLLGALGFAYQACRIRLSRDDRRHLVKTVVPDGGRMPRTPWSVHAKSAVKMLKATLDANSRDWRPRTQRLIEHFLDMQAARSLEISPKIDLLIVDEAHKLEGDRRGRVVTQLLSRKFLKGVWVTATPFALSVSELQARLTQFQEAAKARRDYASIISNLPLEAYRQAVSSRTDFPRLDELQSALRKRMVRSTWDNQRERRILDWTGEAKGAALLPSMALERVIANVIVAGNRTHIASARETLCSSWAATLEALQNGALKRFRGDPWVERLRSALLDTCSLDPKLQAAVHQIVKLAIAGEKTVVFTHRTETSKILVKTLQRDSGIRALNSQYQNAAKQWRGRAAGIKRALGMRTIREAYTLAKIIAHSPDAPRTATAKAIREWWRAHEKTLSAQSRSAGKKDVFEFLEWVAGRAKHLPLIARYDGKVVRGDESEPDAVSNDRKFNLPCAPLILIASSKGQEGIDLHHYCRRVVLYDLPWNPAIIEQRIGRVHRLGGIRSRRRPVEVVYCYQKGSYEELIAKRVKQRCEMMHALLGAGTWLNEDQQVDNLERYRMTFPP
jgi:superfamily II DNA or RNA helicase